MNWETRHEKLYKGGVLIQHRVQRTPDGPWEDYVPEEPPPVKKAQPKAFPNLVGQLGMDLRDYFAAKAVHSFLIGAFMEGRDITYKDMAEEAYYMADAMMKAREQ